MNSNKNNFKTVTNSISEAIDAYQQLIGTLETRKPKPKKPVDLDKVKDFLFKKVF